MKICKTIYEQILLKIPEYPPEIGGILGARKNVIDEYWIDQGIGNVEKKYCSYEPDTKMLNKIIQEWSDKGITFKGIFHTHFFGSTTLSEGDIQYIKTIMRYMPKTIKKLYFPIFAMPKGELIVYVALKGKEITITQEEFQFKEDGL